MTNGHCTLVRFLSVLVCLAPLLSTMAATRYRVTLAYPGDDASVIAERLAAAYHGQLEAPVVASGAATPWMSGTYEYDPAGNIRRIGTSLYVYDAENRLSYEKAGTTRQQELTYDGFGNIRTIAERTNVRTMGVDAGTNQSEIRSCMARRTPGSASR